MPRYNPRRSEAHGLHVTTPERLTQRRYNEYLDDLITSQLIVELEAQQEANHEIAYADLGGEA